MAITLIHVTGAGGDWCCHQVIDHLRLRCLPPQRPGLTAIAVFRHYQSNQGRANARPINAACVRGSSVMNTEVNMKDEFRAD